MIEGPLSARAQREQDAFDDGLQRDGYMRLFEHTSHLFLQRRARIIQSELEHAQGKNVLELGSTSWKSWIEDNDIKPRNLYCINISQEEINRGKESEHLSKVKPYFSSCDTRLNDNSCFTS